VRVAALFSLKVVLIFPLVLPMIGHVLAGIHARKMVSKLELAVKLQTAKAEFHHQQLPNRVNIFHLV